MMKDTDTQLKENLLNEITNSKMTLERKLKVMRLLDEAFRKFMGIIYLTDKEIENNDILNRSM